MHAARILTIWILGALASLAIAWSAAASVIASNDAAGGMPESCKASVAGAMVQQEARKSVLAFASRHLDSRPAPLSHLHTEGTLPHQGIRDQSVAAEKDWQVMRQAALAWRISGEARYLQQVDDYLTAWAAVYQPDFNPIDETNLDALIQAYTLTADALPPPTRSAAQKLLRTLGEGYVERIQEAHRPLPSSAINNWQSHRVKLITLVAVALEDRGMLATAHELFRRQVNDNIRPDGSVLDFTERDALHYVVYDLQPLVQAAIAAQSYGVGDWLHERAAHGASVADALAWLQPYAKGQRTHQEFAHTQVKFDTDRLKAGESGYSGPWDPKSSSTLFWLAAEVDDGYLPVAKQLAPQPPDWIAACR